MNGESVIFNEIEFTKKKTIYCVIKRLFDILVATFGIIISIPILLITMICVKIDSKGPALLKQERIGKNGRIIKIYKFRSMVLNADEILFEMLAANEEIRKEYNLTKKLENDPRITRVGKFIRKTSIDELPQLFNILKGDMSLVGPRPYLEREVKDMGKYYDIITKMTPGLTGYWQVHGRSNTTFQERLKLDKKYYEICGIKEDLKIFFKTFAIVFQKDGAK